MSDSAGNSILIVDDDPRFRQIVSAPLLVSGYRVIEARSAYEATTAISQNRIALAIVDNRLPEVDGITWITQVRERGIRIPIVFISGNACDAKTFNRLRNILKVSLVLQKPIMPDLLLDQLESFLPPRTIPSTHPIDISEVALDQQENQNSLVTSSVVSEDAQSVYENKDENMGQELALKPTKREDSRIRVQNAIKLAKQEYFKQLPGDWSRLTNLVHEFRKDKTDTSSRQAALEAAHRLGGTAGSLGFSEIGLTARRVEDLLKVIDPNEPAQYELMLSEIIRQLAQGENSIQLEADTTIKVQVAGTNKANSTILLFTDPTTLDENTVSYCRQVDCELIMADTSDDAFMKAKTTSIDGVVVDLTTKNYLNSLDFCKSLRETNIDLNLPLACIISPQQPIDPAELLYIGFSYVLNTPVANNDLLKTICKLLSARQATKRRVLVIDDDEALSSFIASVLSVEGILVQTLSDPIQALNQVETFRPDLVLLDVMMLGISGYDVCRLLRATDKWHNLPILYLTSKTTPESRILAFKAGGDDFLGKPVVTEELIARTNIHLDKALMKRRSVEYSALTRCLKREAFFKKLYELLNNEESSIVNGSVCLMAVDLFDELSNEHGTSAAEEVMTRLGRMLQIRFPSTALRARCSQKSFALYLPGEETAVVDNAIKLLSEEFHRLTFCNQKGEEFQTDFSSSSVNFPADAESIETILGLAYERLVKSREVNLGLLISHKK
jgi:DNA-binding response OmpR family regulator